MTLPDDRLARFARQLLVPGLGEIAQLRLQGSTVRAVGAGAHASAALVYLVQAGVGRLWIDDPETVAPSDLAGWLFAPGSAGTWRAGAASEALARLSGFTKVEPYPVGGVPTATLVAAPSIAQALAAAEVARRTGIPHVVLEPDADGGSVVTIPVRAPCYSCARSSTGEGRPPEPAAAALAALAAAELIQLVANPGAIPGRRLELVRGVADARPTSRLAGCACGLDPRAAGAQSAPRAT